MSPRLRLSLVALSIVAALAACDRARKPKPRTPAEVRAELRRLLPSTVRDRDGWAADVQAAFASLQIEPSTSNLCAALAVTEQESTYTADPEVPGLGRIALQEIERRASRLHIPPLAVRAALSIDSPDGQPWSERIRRTRTERELSAVFEAMIAEVPMGGRLLARANPVRTGGPMQVSIAFAERHAHDRTYPYPVKTSIRNEVFTRRGGMYFGIAHLLGYEASYKRPIYRFADFNAGWYASRNAAFQRAVTLASGVPLDLDGDLIRHEEDENGSDVSRTEAAVRTLAPQLEMSEAQIRRALSRAGRHDFEETELYERVFALAEQSTGRSISRAALPQIRLSSPKITRRLTTEWFATRVDARYRRCMQRGGGKR
ncbi:DUF1615 domain-containing protein [Lysobacter humi (ex Lee et al. 2017)]